MARINYKKKILNLLKSSQVKWTDSATRDIYSLGLTERGVLQAIVEHIQKGGEIKKKRMRRSEYKGKPAYEMTYPTIEEMRLYIKVQFGGPSKETLLIVSAHTPREGR